MEHYYCHNEDVWKPASEFSFLVPLNGRYYDDSIPHFKEITYWELFKYICGSTVSGENKRLPIPRAVCTKCRDSNQTLDIKYKQVISWKVQLTMKLDY